jgi:16S rRNA (cytosine1402-N4)-methyltransferase
MAINEELGALRRGLSGAAALLAPGGRLAVVSFHDGEDGLVKRSFRAWAADGRARLVARKVRPGRAEVLVNRRARSAVLRAVENIAPESRPCG